MRATDLVRWHRAVNEIRYKHNELELLKEMSEDYGPIFRQHLQRYCEENEVDLPSLEKQRGLSVSIRKGKENHERAAIEEETGGALVVADEHMMDEEPAPPAEPESKDTSEVHEVFKKLFKKLATHLHPDRVMGLTEEERHDRLEMFKEAKQALDEERYFFLLDLSDRFKVRLPRNYRQQTRWMKNKIKQLDREIKTQQATYNFAYAECETEEEKEKLIKMFLKQLYGI